MRKVFIFFTVKSIADYNYVNQLMLIDIIFPLMVAETINDVLDRKKYNKYNEYNKFQHLPMAIC